MDVTEKKIINPASGAIVMALGIFLHGVMSHFLSQSAERWFALTFLFLAIVIYSKLVQQFFQKDFLTPFLNNPVNSFVIGSWIAGFSVLGIVLENYTPLLHSLAVGVAVINSCLWVFFIYVSMKNFKRLWQRPTFHATHGVVLLSAVAAQSLVVLWEKMFPGLPDLVSLSAFGLGVFFYANGLMLILKRYLSTDWSLIEDWTNTNCIIHGGLSITGLAMITTNLLDGLLLYYYWLVVLIVFCLVEGVEVLRAIKRIQQKGWKEGIFTYHISQWSRNFTFGMFFAFTMAMRKNSYDGNLLHEFHHFFLPVLALMVLLALLIEVTLWACEVLVGNRFTS
ncbi:hypothetical protein [Thalassobacillus devorans]|uniref:hypothetical protein n=1 Tax=Thalassobacillus devorans TaxID=279813 RepID=UPI000A1C9EC5|nr:hypothetical protein [Thalassobacillus devorans]